MAHHPDCERFEDHVVRIRGTRVCMGCLFTYPPAIVLVAAVLLLRPAFLPGYHVLFALTCLIFCLLLLRKVLFKKPLEKSWGIFFRLIRGMGLGLGVVSILLAEGKPRMLLAATLGVVLLSYSIYSGLKAMKVCKVCPSYEQFPYCTGDKKVA